ncbi:Oidioi.mRNA.OKI2018_I69.PAR.g10481.t1.cds [Oikopleura dioica]|uniref:Oidioi.mRNA.OKI2018_I69.PAR.g10481.t1.cds n=1 Tax=Oikopleura dioica TaxID=34765 RepID=A0ABN7RQS3_OIKDI|nr:Oidioi.mRNA.OKI2018_I69.PAR.g10481.t1.cds [Oikopleura dioica]
MLRPRIGGVLLILVDIIWIIFSQLKDYVFKDVHFDKPYFSTYLNYSFFTVYLLGFLVYKPWGRQCVRCTCADDYYYNVLENTEDEDDSTQSDTESCSSFEALSQSQYIEIHLPSCPSDDSADTTMRVKFSPTAEVKSLPDSTSEKIARMSHLKSRRARQTNKIMKSTRKMTFIAKYAFLFTLPLFMADYCRVLARTKTSAPVSDILQSTAGVFTLILGAIFPASTIDKFSVLKFIFAILMMGGMVLISVGGSEEIYVDASTGTILSLISTLSISIF